MSFIGFIYANHTVRAASQQASEQLGMLFEAVTMGGEDSVRIPATPAHEKDYADGVVNAFKGAKNIVVIDEERLKRGLEGENLLGPDSALSDKFMNGCLAFNTAYLMDGDYEDVYAAFTDTSGKTLSLTFVSIDVLENEPRQITGVTPDDVQAATKAIPAYMRELGASIYTAARDASFVQHAERALQGQYRSFDNCDLRVIGTDKATGKTATTLQTTVSRGRMAPDRGAYAKTLQLGATN